MNLTKAQILQWLQAVDEVITENKDYLTELDAAIGDGDHGINLHRGFQKVMTQLPQVETEDIGSIFKTVGMALVSSVGGASGPLYGTFFLRASTVVTGKEELTVADLAKLLQEGVNGVIQRGKANPGDKTMLDALCPAVTIMDQEVAGGNNSIVDVLGLAVLAAETGMHQTIALVARKGRASYLGERSIGHQDPGATSSYLILKTLLETINPRT